jgi:hypothetical protein
LLLLLNCEIAICLRSPDPIIILPKPVLGVFSF